MDQKQQRIRHSFRSAMLTGTTIEKAMSFIETSFMKTRTDIALLRSAECLTSRNYKHRTPSE